MQVAIVLREHAGRFVWRANLNLFPPDIAAAPEPVSATKAVAVRSCLDAFLCARVLIMWLACVDYVASVCL